MSYPHGRTQEPILTRLLVTKQRLDSGMQPQSIMSIVYPHWNHLMYGETMERGRNSFAHMTRPQGGEAGGRWKLKKMSKLAHHLWLVVPCKTRFWAPLEIRNKGRPWTFILSLGFSSLFLKIRIREISLSGWCKCVSSPCSSSFTNVDIIVL